jgi:hypothetical protein
LLAFADIFVIARSNLPKHGPTYFILKYLATRSNIGSWSDSCLGSSENNWRTGGSLLTFPLRISCGLSFGNGLNFGYHAGITEKFAAFVDTEYEIHILGILSLAELCKYSP